MTYVDGFVLPVPTKNLAAYRKMARLASKVWLEHGALSYHEAVGDDLAIGFGTSFPTYVKPKKGETIVFAWIVYKSKAHRNKINKLVMQDQRLAAMCGDPKKMPFDVKRMACGGFKTLVSA